MLRLRSATVNHELQPSRHVKAIACPDLAECSSDAFIDAQREMTLDRGKAQ